MPAAPTAAAENASLPVVAASTRAVALLGIDTATNDVAVASASARQDRLRARLGSRRRRPAAALAPPCSSWSPLPSPRRAAGSGSRRSPSASGPGRSPACGSGSRPRAPSARRAGVPLVAVRSLAALAERHRASARTAAAGADRRPPRARSSRRSRAVRERHLGRRSSPAGGGRGDGIAKLDRAPVGGRRRLATISAGARVRGRGGASRRGPGAPDGGAERVRARRGGGPGRPEQVRPIYLEKPDAEVWRRATRRGMGPAAEAGAGAGVRGLVYGDLPAVLAIERRSFQTPWSLAMFVLELSKPSGICLGDPDERRAFGYLVCSRYADVWHLMNIAVAPERRREGIARELMEGCSRRPAPSALHARGADLEPSGDRDVRALRLPRRGPPPPLLPRQRRGRPVMWLEPSAASAVGRSTPS